MTKCVTCFWLTPDEWEYLSHDEAQYPGVVEHPTLGYILSSVRVMR